jgi:hypothetical protein
VEEGSLDAIDDDLAQLLRRKAQSVYAATKLLHGGGLRHESVVRVDRHRHALVHHHPQRVVLQL